MNVKQPAAKKKKQKLAKHILLMWRTSAIIKVLLFLLAVFFLSSWVIYLIEHKTNSQFPTYFDSLYYMMVTIATVGYGDKVPITFPGRLVAMAMMVFGVALLGTITGRIASFLMERQMKEENGLLSFERLKDHFVICGWKREMNHVLYDILANHPSLDSTMIVLINKASHEDMDTMRNDPLLKGVHYVHGDFIEERDLVRAGIRTASRVLVVSDYLTEGNLQQIDSKTVMAVMTIKNLNKKAYVCAEILDTKFEKYLQISHCDEILLSRQFSRSMLAFASIGVGMSHIIRSLLTKESGARIATLAFPDSFIGRTYGDLSSYAAQEHKGILIGILENTGNIVSRKQEALREAQKNPDIAQIIPELKTVKTLTANNPVINPPVEYQIKKHSVGIIIAGSTVCAA
jgi:voltage-gated potassium channel